ncbi:hypothetical protein IW249_006712 [Micromonospora vinacea]|uniref:DUF4340 domain-containing protein n=1 Tax=Micromonospora vinacea TaxID=709878 RepID=A0ABS0KDQ0_9ACTN|nr:hypothetical protein [Micromonospora vinacea]MBG6106298.1 hypothetical protein [Micromonospora vinacea]
MRTRVVALEAQTGRRERPCSSPRRVPARFTSVDTSPTPAPDTARTATPRPEAGSTGNGPAGGGSGPTSGGSGPASGSGRHHTGSAGGASVAGRTNDAKSRSTASRTNDTKSRSTTGRSAGGARRATVGRKTDDTRRAAAARSLAENRDTARRDDTPDTADTTGAADTTGPTSAGRRRRTVLLLLGLTAVTSATALVLGLLSWAPDPPEPARPLTVAESERLAAVRVTNLRDLRAGVRVTAGTGATRIELVGWVDWSRSLLYLDVGGPGAGAERGLLQKSGPVLVIRPDPAAVPTPAAPPLVAPEDRWRLHRLAPRAQLAPVLDLLLDLAADRPDTTTRTAPSSGARWIARETVPAGALDVIQAPLARGLPAASTAIGTPGAATPAPDGQTRYWLDQDARLHKLVTRLPGAGPVTMIFNRADRPTLRPVDALGGRPGLPRALTDAEQRRLDRLPARLRAQGGATLTLTAPMGTTTNLRGAGWLSWTARSAYLAVADLGVPDRRTLLRRDAAGLARADLPAASAGGGTAEAPARPPLPPPAVAWRVSRPGRDALSVLVDAAVTAGSVGHRGTAVRVREDVAAGRTVDIIESGPADARLRYWIDRDGSLRRLELRTDAGAWAHLDLRPAVVPRLAANPRPAAPRPSAPRSSAPRPGAR